MRSQEPRGKFHATVSLDKATALNATDAVQQLNKRLAALSGLPEAHLEEGYFSIYNSGYRLESLHLDNHHVLMEPRRVLSFVIYLHSEDQMAGTVFPLAQTDDGTSVLVGEQMQDEVSFTVPRPLSSIMLLSLSLSCCSSLQLLTCSQLLSLTLLCLSSTSTAGTRGLHAKAS